MSDLLLAEFDSPEATLKAAAMSASAGRPAMDALSPQPVEGIDDHLAPQTPRASIGWVMTIAAFSGAVFGYAIQWYSAAIDFPLLSGGRPFNSWQVFLIVPYEAAILFAGVFGFIGWLWICRLPKLYHPLFDAKIVERASSDRYLLVFAGSAAILDAVSKDLTPLKARLHRTDL